MNALEALRRRLDTDHERATMLAADRLGGPIPGEDAAWLDAHLQTCPACRTVAEAYEADREALHGLRIDPPAPPRDLWARTSAALDAESARRAAPPDAGVGRRIRRSGVGLPLGIASAATAIALIVVIAGPGLAPGPAPSGAPAVGPTPFPIALREIPLYTVTADGRIEIAFGQFDQACPLDATGTCALGRIERRSQVDAPTVAALSDVLLSPNRSHAVVVERGGGSGPDRLVVIQIPDGTSAPTPDAATPPPTSAPTAASAPPASDPPPPSTPVLPTVEPPTVAPSGTAPTAEPPTTAPSADPTSTGSPPPPVTPPPSDPASAPPASPDPTPTITPAPPTPSPTPILVTPEPDGAISIASDVILVGDPGYSADGEALAFSARPADGSTGPDVYVWRVGTRKALPLTDDHGSYFAGWHGEDLLVSRVEADGDEGRPSTVVLDPANGRETRIRGRAWLPRTNPDGTLGAWWDGTLARAEDGIWRPADGGLVVGAWPPAGNGAAPVELPVADVPVTWEAHWDATGTRLAIWSSPDASATSGTLELFELGGSATEPELRGVILEPTRALRGVAIAGEGLAWRPADNPERIEVLAWGENGIGRIELEPGDGLVIGR